MLILGGDAEQHIEVRGWIVFHVDRWQEYSKHMLTIDISYAHAKAMSKHCTFGSAGEVQAAAGMYSCYKFEVYINLSLIHI